MRFGRYVAAFALVAVVFSAAAFVTTSLRRNGAALQLRRPWHVTYPQEESGVRPGPEIAMVFVDSPTCVWCNAKELPAVIVDAKSNCPRLFVRYDSGQQDRVGPEWHCSPRTVWTL